MRIGFIGNFQQGPGGEDADEVHLARELEGFGNEIIRIPRDEWREYVIEGQPENKYNIPEDIELDICLIAKWHHFYDGRFVVEARKKFCSPIFLWVWDSMEGHTVGDWHMNMAQEADLYLSGELGRADFYRRNKVRFYYFQFDSADGQFSPVDSVPEEEKKYDVIYPGSLNNQNGRFDLLKAINEKVKIKVFAYDYEDWIKQGFDASPAVYGQEFNQVVAESKIVLGTSCDPNCYGYWSNRVGKVLYAGGFLLQQYTPGMEQFLANKCWFYSSPEEALEEIKIALENPYLRFALQDWNKNNYEQDFWTSEYKVLQLHILIERYLKSNGGEKWLLP